MTKPTVMEVIELNEHEFIELLNRENIIQFSVISKNQLAFGDKLERKYKTTFNLYEFSQDLSENKQAEVKSIKLVGIKSAPETFVVTILNITKPKQKKTKRMDVISWDQYFMGVAVLASKRSKDPLTQVGACVIKDNKIIGTGYNGFPKGCSDNVLPWAREGAPLDTKYMYVVHAEANAILNSQWPITDAILYSTIHPCNECTKLIIQSGISKVVYLYDKHDGADFNIAAKRMLTFSGIKVEQGFFNNFKLEYEV